MTQPTPPPHASDPAVLTDGTVVPREVPPSVGGGSFTVDLEHAPAAIVELRAARLQLNDLRDQATRLGKVAPPSPDPVSTDAAAILSAVAVGGSGSLLSALDAGITRLDQLIVAVEADISTYGAAERIIRGLVSGSKA